MAADVARRLEVVLLVDGGGKEWRQVAHLEVQGVVEAGDLGRWRRRDLSILVALEADGFRGQQVVGCLGAAGRRGVACGARKLQAEVELMREGRGVRHTPRHTPGRAP